MSSGKTQRSDARLRPRLREAGVLAGCPRNAGGWTGVSPLDIVAGHPVEMSDYSPNAIKAVAEKKCTIFIANHESSSTICHVFSVVV